MKVFFFYLWGNKGVELFYFWINDCCLLANVNKNFRKITIRKFRNFSVPLHTELVKNPECVLTSPFLFPKHIIWHLLTSILTGIYAKIVCLQIWVIRILCIQVREIQHSCIIWTEKKYMKTKKISMIGEKNILDF